MHKKVFMYGFLTMTFVAHATDLPTMYERTERSPLSASTYHQQENAARQLNNQESVMSKGNASPERVAPNITVSIHDNGPIEATFSLSDNQTKYFTTLAAVLLVCCTVVVTQNSELIVRLLEQK